ncbi:hypothetical protein MYX82_05400 [Acidobacteria bacterium AH-259-D05]|nr:hypothetical protein [Acidobacteria bacterium AH-259-D05]
MKGRGKLELLAIFLTMGLWLNAGVRREIQSWYIQNYENKAMFLKVPIRGTRQIVHVRASGSRLDPESVTRSLLFKVGDQVRITEVNFRGHSVRFKIASVDLVREGEIEFLFRQQLKDDFPQRGTFDVTLQATLTEGLLYTDIDSAKQEFIQSQFDQFVQQLARSNNTSSDFVVKIMGENIPGYQALKEEANETKSQLQKAQQDLQAEKKIKLHMESEVNRLEKQSDQIHSELTALEAERNKLLTEIDRLSTNYQNQMKKLVETLNLKTSSATSLEAQVEVLNESIGTIRNQQLSRAREVTKLSEQVAALEKTNQELSQDLKQAQDEKEKLWGDFSALTSNRQSLEARYIETKRENEQLQNSALLNTSFNLKKRVERREENEFQLADLYLLSQRIGTLEVQIPPLSGTVHPLRFTADSPDTVKFSEEERKIYELLGETFQIETAWETSSSDLKIVLLNMDAAQSVSPRKSIEWPWMFQGEIAQPERVALTVHLISSEGSRIFLGSQDFSVSPGQMMARLRSSISPVSLLAGALVGLVVFGILFGFRGRSHSPSKTDTSRRLVVEKKL